jgi:hypothetical protein
MQRHFRGGNLLFRGDRMRDERQDLGRHAKQHEAAANCHSHTTPSGFNLNHG